MAEFIKPISKIVLNKLIVSMQVRSRKQLLEQWQLNFTRVVLPKIMSYLEFPSEQAASQVLKEVAESVRTSSSPLRASVLTWIQSGLDAPYSESRMTFILRRILQCYDSVTLSDLVSKGSGNSYAQLVTDLKLIYGVSECDSLALDDESLSKVSEITAKCPECGAVYAYDHKDFASRKIACQNCAKLISIESFHVVSFKQEKTES